MTDTDVTLAMGALVALSICWCIGMLVWLASLSRRKPRRPPAPAMVRRQGMPLPLDLLVTLFQPGTEWVVDGQRWWVTQGLPADAKPLGVKYDEASGLFFLLIQTADTLGDVGITRVPRLTERMIGQN